MKKEALPLRRGFLPGTWPFLPKINRPTISWFEASSTPVDTSFSAQHDTWNRAPIVLQCSQGDSRHGADGWQWFWFQNRTIFLGYFDPVSIVLYENDAQFFWVNWSLHRLQQHHCDSGLARHRFVGFRLGYFVRRVQFTPMRSDNVTQCTVSIYKCGFVFALRRMLA